MYAPLANELQVRQVLLASDVLRNRVLKELILTGEAYLELLGSMPKNRIISSDELLRKIRQSPLYEAVAIPSSISLACQSIALQYNIAVNQDQLIESLIKQSIRIQSQNNQVSTANIPFLDNEDVELKHARSSRNISILITYHTDSYNLKNPVGIEAIEVGNFVERLVKEPSFERSLDQADLSIFPSENLISPIVFHEAGDEITADTFNDIRKDVVKHNLTSRFIPEVEVWFNVGSTLQKKIQITFLGELNTQVRKLENIANHALSVYFYCLLSNSLLGIFLKAAIHTSKATVLAVLAEQTKDYLNAISSLINDTENHFFNSSEIVGFSNFFGLFNLNILDAYDEALKFLFFFLEEKSNFNKDVNAEIIALPFAFSAEMLSLLSFNEEELAKNDKKEFSIEDFKGKVTDNTIPSLEETDSKAISTKDASIDSLDDNKLPKSPRNFVSVVDDKVFRASKFANIEGTLARELADDGAIHIDLGGGQYEVVVSDYSSNIVIYDFGGIGKGVDPTVSILEELDVIKFEKDVFSRENIFFQQADDNLVIKFYRLEDFSITLKNFALELIDNIPYRESQSDFIGNILFYGDIQIQDSFDVVSSGVMPRYVFNANQVTFLNELNNSTNGLNNSDDTIYGLSGNDQLFGRSGQDRLYGGDGHDSLHGGQDDDLLSGGPGNDIFFLSSDGSKDIVVDFTVGEDTLVFSRNIRLDDIKLDVSESLEGGSTTIKLISTDEVIGELLGVSPFLVDPSSFVSEM
ncbi:MAG: hypothetical protein AAF959_09445 [Cyanobacteria bacterium P01_D01_bin.56]